MGKWELPSPVWVFSAKAATLPFLCTLESWFSFNTILSSNGEWIAGNWLDHTWSRWRWLIQSVSLLTKRKNPLCQCFKTPKTSQYPSQGRELTLVRIAAFFQSSSYGLGTMQAVHMYGLALSSCLLHALGTHKLRRAGGFVTAEQSKHFAHGLRQS